MNAPAAIAWRVTFESMPAPTNSRFTTTPRPRWGTARIALVVFLLWSALAALSVLSAAVTMPPGMTAIPWGPIIAVRFADWYSCLLFVPAFVWLSRRFPVTESGWTRSITVLFFASAVFVVLKYLIFLPITRALSGRSDMTFARLLGGNALIELIIFWAVIAVIQAFEFRRRLLDEEHNAIALQAQLAEAQLAALSAQLQPHFLFNTLSAVATLMHRDVAEADRMIVRLGDLLRATLARRASHQITLGEELELLERYLDIMRVRFNDRLTVNVDVPAELQSALVPQLLLQPLVENALEHGIARHPGPGAVSIEAKCSGGSLYITVIDNGPGIDPAGGSLEEGIGLATTRARLARLYGESQRLTLTRAERGGGTCVSVQLPWQQVYRDDAIGPIH
jgi:two-component system LytT family sensor kinase